MAIGESASSRRESAFGSLASSLEAVIWLLDGASLAPLAVGGRAAAEPLRAAGSVPPPDLLERLIDERDRPCALTALRAVAQDGQTRLVRHRAPGAGERWLASAVLRLAPDDRDGQRPRLLGISSPSAPVAAAAEPSSESARAQASPELLDAVFRASPVGICAFGPDGLTPKLWNPAAEEILGWRAAEVIGKPFPPPGYAPGEKAAENWGLVQRKLKGEALRNVEVVRRRKDGRAVVLSLSSARLRPDDPHDASGVSLLVDVTERKMAERALDAARRRYEELVDSIDGIVWEAELPGPKFVFVSSRAERLLGYPAARWLEPGFWEEHIHPADRAWAVAFCAKRTLEGTSHEFEYRMIAADGRTVWLRDLVNVVTVNGHPERLRGVMVDVTARKRAEAERDRLLVREKEARESAEAARRRSDFLARASDILAGSLDYETTLREVAQLALPQLADWCIVDLVGDDERLRRVAVTHTEPHLAVTAKDYGTRTAVEPSWPYCIAPELRAGRPQLLTEITDEMLELLPADDQSRRALLQMGSRSLVGAPLIARGRMLGVIVLVYGSSGRCYHAPELRLVELLASRAALAVDNARLYAEAREAVRARDEFLSIASHELRTPCTSLQLGVQSLLRLADRGALARAPPGMVRTVLETAERQSKRLAQLIDKLLDLSRLRAGRLVLDLEPVDLAELTREVIGNFHEELARSKSTLDFKAEEPVVGRWDASRVSQIITNLVSNAIKYGAGRPIEVAVLRQGRLGQLTVRDHGIGIPPEKQARIFGRFERAVSTRNYGGLGLGLYIARQIANALGGDIDFVSRPGSGTTFTVALPLEGPGARPAPEEWGERELGVSS